MGSLNAVTDIITVCLPMFVLKGLQMKRSKKLQVAATFLVGGFVCIVSIYRVPTQAGISLVDFSCTFHIHRLFLGKWLTDADTDTDVEACNWSFVELSVAICCACLITYRPLLRLSIDAVTGKSGKSSVEGTPTPSQKRVWAKKLDPYDTDYTVSIDSDQSSDSQSDGKSDVKIMTKVTVQEV